MRRLEHTQKDEVGESLVPSYESVFGCATSNGENDFFSCWPNTACMGPLGE
jgi:hypothetical protein